MSSLGARLVVCTLSVLALACGPTEPPPSELLIGPQGGTLTFANGAVVLTIPAGAVSQATQFTAVPTTSFPSGPTVLTATVYDIGPSGLTFSQPVSLRVTFPPIGLPTSIREIELGVYKVVSGAWQLNATSQVDTTANTLTASISSLSVFGILGAPAASLEITPASTTVAIGASTQLTATVRDATNKVLPSRPVGWSSLEPTIASVNATGSVSGAQAGAARIVGAHETVADTAVVTVQQPSGLNPACPAYPTPAIPAPARTFFVNAAAGNDAANGLTPQTAWKTLEKTNQTAQPGDLFNLNGTFQDEWIRPGTSGTAAQKIVWQRASGGTAVLLGGRFDVIVDLTQRQHIVILGLELAQAPEPFRLFESQSNWLRGLYVHDAGGSNLRANSSDNRVEDSGFDRIGSEAANTGDAIYLSNGSDRNTLVRNVFGPAGHGAIWLSHQGVSDLPSSDNIIAHNLVVNPWANAIGLNGTANRTLVECNRTFATANGTGPNYARDGFEVEGTDNIVRYNVIATTGDEGITIEGWTFNGQVQSARRNHIHNNTIFSNAGGGIELIRKDVAVVEDNIIENNIFWANAGHNDAGTRYSVLIDQFNSNTGVFPPGTIGGNIIRNNIFEDNLTFMLMTRKSTDGGNVTFTLAAAQGLFPGWANNFQADPLFTNPGLLDFSLATTSPAIDAGRVIAGRPFLGPAPDLGAFEKR